MHISEVTYLGSLRTKATHLKSGNEIVTDAPPDNKGKGEAFSPTDLMATSLASCMMTLMGIKADENDIAIDDIKVDVTKEMESNPRKIGVIRLDFEISGANLTDAQKELLEDAALNCPVALSIDPQIKKDVNFDYK